MKFKEILNQLPHEQKEQLRSWKRTDDKLFWVVTGCAVFSTISLLVFSIMPQWLCSIP